MRVRKRRIYFNRFRRGDVVRYCSKIRPDLLPATADRHGIVLSAGMWNVVVSFNEFPDEPILVGAKELKYATGIRAGKTQSELDAARRKKQLERTTQWK